MFAAAAAATARRATAVGVSATTPTAAAAPTTLLRRFAVARSLPHVERALRISPVNGSLCRGVHTTHGRYAAAAAEGAPTEKASSEKQQQQQQQQEHSEGGAEADGKQIPEGDAGPDIPFVGKVGATLKVLFKVAFGGAIVGLAGYAGYYILRIIMPTSSSPLAIRNDAAKILSANPDVANQFGQISRVRGMDMGGRGEGRRNYVPSYTYDSEGKQFTRIKFQVDNDKKQPATVFAEISSDRTRPDQFNYLMLKTHAGRVVVIQDDRKPEKPTDMRKYDVCSKLQNESARFYHGGPTDMASTQQERILSPHFDYLKIIRCDRDPARCEAEGYKAGTLVYREKPLKAPMSLEDLEKLVGLSRYTRPGGVAYQDATELS